MIELRNANQRGHANHGWLDTYHSFSFAQYHDPEKMGFRSLRVINEDRVQPGQGFGTHGHQNMEIISYVLEGELEHRDSMGNGSVLKAGDFQRISAGSGITHSEFNPSKTNSVHFYQIWILPWRKGVNPSYQEKSFSKERNGGFLLVASADGRHGSLSIEQDASVLLASLEAGKEAIYKLDPGRAAWVQVLRGSAVVNGCRLEASDGAAITDENSLIVRADSLSEVMVFDLA